MTVQKDTVPQAQPTGSLLSITQGTEIHAPAPQIILEGVGGVGKTTIAAQIPGNILLDEESGSGRVIGQYLRVGASPDYETFIGKLQEIYTRRDELGVRCLTIDSLDAIEELMVGYIFRTRPLQYGKTATSIEDYGFGKGYTYIAELMDDLQRYLDAFRAVGISILIIAHVKMTTISPPVGDPYTVWGIKTRTPKRGGNTLIERSDAVLMADYEMIRMQDGKVADTSKRVLYTQASTIRPDLKNRFGLDAKIPFEYSSLKAMLG